MSTVSFRRASPAPGAPCSSDVPVCDGDLLRLDAGIFVLHFAQTGRLEIGVATERPTGSAFEEQVARALRHLGVPPNVDPSGRVVLARHDVDLPGQPDPGRHAGGLARPWSLSCGVCPPISVRAEPVETLTLLLVRSEGTPFDSRCVMLFNATVNGMRTVYPCHGRRVGDRKLPR